MATKKVQAALSKAKANAKAVGSRAKAAKTRTAGGPGPKAIRAQRTESNTRSTLKSQASRRALGMSMAGTETAKKSAVKKTASAAKKTATAARKTVKKAVSAVKRVAKKATAAKKKSQYGRANFSRAAEGGYQSGYKW